MPRVTLGGCIYRRRFNQALTVVFAVLVVAVKISLLRDFKNDTATETGVNAARDETAPLSRAKNVAG